MTITLSNYLNNHYDTPDAHDFEPYTHQAGGHCSILKFDGGVCKPLVQRECEFYRTIHKDIPSLASITPAFYGCIVVPSNSTQQRENSNNTTKAGPAVTSGDSETLDHYQYYIVLQDLTAGMRNPCVMDMKMGTHRQRFDTSVSLGFRICGMRVWRGCELYSVDRLFGRGLTSETVEDAVGAFIFNGSSILTALIPPILSKLHRIIGVVEHSPFRFYTSSLLFIYDGAGHPDSVDSVDVRLVDFAHAIYKGTKEGEADDGFLFGMRNLVALFENILHRHSYIQPSDSDARSDSEESEESDVNSSDDLSESSTDEDMDTNLSPNNIPVHNNNSNRCLSFPSSKITPSIELSVVELV